MNSPLGKYAPVAAFITTVGVIAAYLLALMLQKVLGMTDGQVGSLHDFAILAFGAIVGSAVAVNGWKQPLASAHERIDRLEAATQVSTHVPVDPPPAGS